MQGAKIKVRAKRNFGITGFWPVMLCPPLLQQLFAGSGKLGSFI